MLKKRFLFVENIKKSNTLLELPKNQETSQAMANKPKQIL